MYVETIISSFDLWLHVRHYTYTLLNN